MYTAPLDGPRRKPLSGRADALVVLLHGYGANGDDLIGLADHWAPRFPDVAFASPHAPEPLPFPGMPCFQWFPLSVRDHDEYWEGACSAGPMLEAFLDAELARWLLPASRMMLVGFSQGTMMALHAGLRRKSAPAGIIGYSGRIAGPENLTAEIACKPPVLLVHGSLDDLIPVSALVETRDALQGAGIDVTWHESPSIGHEIDAEGLDLGAQFIERHLGTTA